jgi:peptidyl-prolyl cis-trans isomerase SurA
MFVKPLFCILPLVLIFSVAPSAQGSQRSNSIVAVVNGVPIMKSEVEDTVTAQRQMLLMQLGNNPAQLQAELKKLQDSALENLIDRELILAEFQKAGGTIKDQYIDDDINTLIREKFNGDRNQFVIELAKSGMTMRKFRELRKKMIIVQVMRSQKAARRLPATPKEVEEFYRKNIDSFREKDMLKISTITIPKFTGEPGSTPEAQKQLAEEIRGKVATGADFATTARTYSQDSRSDNGGEWDWMERKLMDKTIADTAFKLKEGGISQVVSMDAAYIIIYLAAKKPGAATPLDKVRNDIERAIEAESSRKTLDEWLASLRKKATIRIM